MVRRIQRAKEEFLRQKKKIEILKDSNIQIDLNERLKKYRYASRHEHAKNRIRDNNGRFKSK